MKRIISILLFVVASQTAMSQNTAKEYKVVTVVESVVPGGFGRSRIIESKSDGDIQGSSSERIAGKDTKQGQVKRKDLKVDNLVETKLLNFYSLTGINFQNIASNDALISAKMNELGSDGWTLVFLTSGVESNAGAQDGDGIFITRLVFSR